MNITKLYSLNIQCKYCVWLGGVLPPSPYLHINNWANKSSKIHRNKQSTKQTTMKKKEIEHLK